MIRAFSASVQMDQIPGALPQAFDGYCAVGAKHTLSLISRFVFCNKSVSALLLPPLSSCLARDGDAAEICPRNTTIYYDYKLSDKLCSHVPVGRLYFGSRPFRMAHSAVATARANLSDGF
jgi:hypothetical protein